MTFLTSVYFSYLPYTKFHYTLGALLYNVSKEQETSKTKDDCAMFPIVDQINHGVPSLVANELQSDIIELNFKSGSRAFDRSDYETAQSYLDHSFALLGTMVPKNHWSTRYEFSLRLFMLSAKVAYACGNIQKAYRLLKEILEVARCLEDELDAYSLRVNVSLTCNMHDSTAITFVAFQGESSFDLVPCCRF